MLSLRNQSLLYSVVLHATAVAAGLCLMGPWIAREQVHAFWMRMEVPDSVPGVEQQTEVPEQPPEPTAEPLPRFDSPPTEMWTLAEQDDATTGPEMSILCDPVPPPCAEPDPQSLLARVIPAKNETVSETRPVTQEPSRPAAVVVHPTPIPSTNRPPQYPPDALRKHLQGTVVVLLHVGAQGSVLRAIIAESSGSSLLDAAALAQLRTWQFLPGTRDGRAVGMDFRQPVLFRIRP